MGTALLIAAASVLSTAPLPAADWNNSDTTWPPGASQNWAIGTNWVSGTAAGSADTANFTAIGDALINTTVSITRLNMGSAVNNDRGIWIASGGSLAVSGIFEVSNAAGSQAITVAAGGSLTGVDIKFGRVSSGGTAIFTNSGTVSSSALEMAYGAQFLMKEGTLSTTRSFASINPFAEGKYIQTGGAATATQLRLGDGGIAQISGGSFTASASDGLTFWGASATEGGTIRVIGSGASSINFNGLRYLVANDQAKATWAFTLDNSANHLTKVQLTSNGSAAGKVRGGTLDVGLNGGVLLSGTNATTLIEAPDILGTSNFVNAADYEGGTAKLWTQSIVNSTLDTLVVSLTAGADKGTLDGTGTNEASFTAANYGYLNLENISLGSPIILSLDITGGTLSNFTNALTGAGIVWAVGSGDYELALTLHPSISGGNYFAWDLADIDGAMGIQGAMVVPEPSTVLLLTVSLGVVLFLRRRRLRDDA